MAEVMETKTAINVGMFTMASSVVALFDAGDTPKEIYEAFAEMATAIRRDIPEVVSEGIEKINAEYVTERQTEKESAHGS